MSPSAPEAGKPKTIGWPTLPPDGPATISRWDPSPAPSACPSTTACWPSSARPDWPSPRRKSFLVGVGQHRDGDGARLRLNGGCAGGASVWRPEQGPGDRSIVVWINRPGRALVTVPGQLQARLLAPPPAGFSLRTRTDDSQAFSHQDLNDARRRLGLCVPQRAAGVSILSLRHP